MNDKYIIHEALDRTCLTIEFINNSIVKHVFFKKNKKFKRKIKKIQNKLFKLYQDIGNESI